MAEPNETRGRLPEWTNSGWGRFLLSLADTQIPGNAFSTNWGTGQAPTHNFTNFREFTGLGGLQRGLSGFGNFLSNAGTGARGIGTSFGRLNDGNSSTGFFNNPTAPWNWGNGPSNVPEGHPDFVGPTRPGGSSSQSEGQTYSPGDPRQWGPFQNPIGQQGMNNWYSGRTGNSFTGNTTQNPIIGYGVASPEQIAAAGSYGVGVNPDGTYSGAGGRNSPTTPSSSTYGGSRVMDAIGSAYGSGPAGLLGMGVRGALLGPREEWNFNEGIRIN